MSPLIFLLLSIALVSSAIFETSRNDIIACVASGRNRMLRRLLIRRLQDVNALEPDGTTPLSLACRLENLGAMNLLLEYQASVRDCMVGDWTCLGFMLKSGNLEGARLLLDYDADPNQPDDFGRPPIYFTVRTDSLEALKLLVHYGVDLHQRDHKDRSLMKYASSKHALNFMLYLARKHGFSIEQELDMPPPPTIEELFSHPFI